MTPRSFPLDRRFTVSVVVPLKDEAPSLFPLYVEIERNLSAAGLEFEIIFVDDGSTDDSVEVLTSIARKDGRVRLVQLRRNFGKAAALSTGFREARGDVVVTMDADQQDDPAEISKLIDALRDGYDVVSGWKQPRMDPWTRRSASKVFNFATRVISRTTLHDVNCGLKAYRIEAAREVADSSYGELHRFLPVLAHWAGFRVGEVAVRHRPRRNGRSRYGMERYLRAFLDLLTASFLARFNRRPMHMFGGAGVVLGFIGSLCLAILAVQRLVFNAWVGGRVLLIVGVLMLISGIQLVLTGLLAELIAAPTAARVPYSQTLVIPEQGEAATHHHETHISEHVPHNPMRAPELREPGGTAGFVDP